MKTDRTFAENLLKKVAEGTATEREKVLLDDFMKDRFERADWDGETLGDAKTVGFLLKKHIDGQIRRKKSWNGWRGYAAAASILMIIGLFILSKVELRGSPKILVSTSVMDSIVLPDGSKIILSPNTKLEYPRQFDKDQRLVSLLEGNAFFKVQRNATKPFKVDAHGLLTEVLGTSFNIRMTQGDITVQVKTGKVQVSSMQGMEQLTLGEGARYDRNSKSLLFLEKGREPLVAWYDSRTVLERISMEETSDVLMNRYGFRLSFSDSTAKKELVTIDLSERDSLESIMEQLAYITNRTFKIKDAHEIEVQHKKQ